MKVTVFGATGFVGSYLIDELLDRGHHPVVLVRPASKHKVSQPARCTLVQGDIAEPAAVKMAIDGADAVIYNIGILREAPARGVTYEALHFEGAKHAMDAAEQAGVRRFILMSANGVKIDGTAYQRTKYRAEQYLASTGLDWTVFRPSVLFGDPRGRLEFATQLYRDVVRSPLPAPLFFDGLLPTDAGMFRMAPVHVKDVAGGLRQGPGYARNGGSQFQPVRSRCPAMADILQTIARAGGVTKRALPAPAPLLKGIAAVLDRYAFFPITRDQLTMLMEGNTCDGQEIFDSFGLMPMPSTRKPVSISRNHG